MADTIGLVATAASGGLLGILGSLLTGGLKIFETRQKRIAKREERQHELELHKLQMAAKAEETEQEIAIAETRGSYDGLAASLAHDASIKEVDKWVNNTRALVRPVLTLLLWILFAIVFYKVINANVTWIKKADRVDILTMMIYSVNTAATMATAWWFGDRAQKHKRAGT